MSKFILLTKVFFLSGFNVNKKKNSQKTAFQLLLSFGLLFLAISIGVNFSLIMNFTNQADITIKALQDAGQTVDEAAIKLIVYNSYLTIVLGLSMVLTLVTTLFQMQGVIFKTNDYEMLESMPLKKPAIVAAKITAAYLTSLVTDLILTVPAVVFYIVYSHNAIGFLFGVFAIPFVSFFPLLFTSVVGLISALITSKSKNASLISVIFSVVFFMAFFGSYMFVIYGGAENLTNVAANIFILDWLQKTFAGDYIYFLYFLLLNVGSAAFVITLISLLYRPINSWILSGSYHEEYKGEEKDAKAESLSKILLKKEWQLLYRKTNYLVNSYLGPFFFVAISAFFVFGYQLFLGTTDPAIIEDAKIIFYALIPAMGLMMLSMSTSTSASISFEGRQGFEMLNTYPIDPSLIIKAKLKIALIINAILSISASLIVITLLLIKQCYDPAILISVAFFPVLAGTFIAIVGMLCGLKWPKLDFENDTQVIKNSGAANFTMLFAMLPSLGVLIVYVLFMVLGGYMNMAFLKYIGLAFVILAYSVGIIVSALILKNNAVKLFNKVLLK